MPKGPPPSPKAAAAWGSPWATDPAVDQLRQAAPLWFLQVRCGDVVVLAPPGEPWSIARVIAVRGGARNPKQPDFLDVYDVDTGEVDWVSEGCVVEILDGVTGAGSA